MKLIPLNCRQCGAPLSVPEDVRRVTCGHCGTQLAVVREGGAFYTKKLAELDLRTSEMAGQIDDLQRQQELIALDQNWAHEKQRYFVSDKHREIGILVKQSTTIIMLGFLGVLMAVLLFLAILQIPAILLMLVSFIYFAMLAGVGGILMAQNARVARYEAAEQAYRQRRAELSRSEEIGSEPEKYRFL